MREIKFRMWTGQRYIYDQNIVFDCMRQQYSGLYDHVKLHESDFEQFTGLHDKNGKEIYEGDILQINYDKMFINQKEKYSKHFIKWDEDYGCFVMIGIDIKTEEGNPPKNGLNKKWIENFGEYFEVIGNIHENPELIK